MAEKICILWSFDFTTGEGRRRFCLVVEKGQKANEVCGVLKVECLKAFYVLEILGEKRIIQAVNEIDLEVSPNVIYGIAGESGCGKTTLLKTLFASIDPPLRLFEGKVYYQTNGKYIDALSLSPREKRALRWTYISYITQGSMSVFNPVKKIKTTFLDVLKSHVQEKVTQDLLLLATKHLKELGLHPGFWMLSSSSFWSRDNSNCSGCPSQSPHHSS